VYRIRQKTTVFDLISMAGGTTEYARTKQIVVMREGSSGRLKFNINLNEMLNGGSESSFYLQPGDMVYVP
jgi:polysaccharide export outer membrane protein